MVELSQKKKNDIKTYFFSIYDKKNKGSIKTDNNENIFLHDALLNSFYYLGIKIKEEEINNLIKQNGFEKNGIINFNDFIRIITNELDSTINKDDIQKYFNVLSEGKDYILKSNLNKILTNFEDISQLLYEIECDDEKIYLHHFSKIFV